MLIVITAGPGDCWKCNCFLLMPEKLASALKLYKDGDTFSNVHQNERELLLHPSPCLIKHIFMLRFLKLLWNDTTWGPPGTVWGHFTIFFAIAHRWVSIERDYSSIIDIIEGLEFHICRVTSSRDELSIEHCHNNIFQHVHHGRPELN